MFFEARSPGGLNAVADADVPDAAALGDVIGDSGVGDFDRVALDAFLDDKSVSLSSSIDPFTDGMFGIAATDDLEVLFQLVHLLMTDARADEAAVDRYVDDQLPFAQDPTIDAGYAEFDALLNTRYDELRFLPPTPETLATVDAAGIERVADERFGDAGDWSFSFSGDYDVDEAIELARAYIGSLPATDTADPLSFDEPPPPPGVVVTEAEAGQGETANVSFLFTSSASSERSDDVLARVVREVIGNRLSDFIREELGDSYSPFAAVDLGGGETPAVETYITVSTAPDLAEEVSAAVLEQLALLRTDGPSELEFSECERNGRRATRFHQQRADQQRGSRSPRRPCRQRVVRRLHHATGADPDDRLGRRAGGHRGVDLVDRVHRGPRHAGRLTRAHAQWRALTVRCDTSTSSPPRIS